MEYSEKNVRESSPVGLTSGLRGKIYGSGEQAAMLRTFESLQYVHGDDVGPRCFYDRRNSCELNQHREV